MFPRWLREQGVTAVIVGGIGRRALDIFAQNGITVRAGTGGEPVEVLAVAYLKGQLTASLQGCAILHKPFGALAISTLMVASDASPRSQRWVNLTFALVTPLGALLFFFGAG